MSTYTALNGKIRFYDSTDVLRAALTGDVQVYDDSTSTFTDKTTEARAADASLTGAFCADTDDLIYIGHADAFARILVNLDTVAEDAGVIVAKYYDGSSWVALTVTDGTDVSGDCFAQNGVISFLPPADWAKGGDAELSSTKYYVQLATTAVPTVPPDAEQIWPVDGQYFDGVFDEGNLSAPEGRPRPEETPVLHRGRIDSNSHHILGSDMTIVEPLELSMSFRLDNTINKEALMEALTCGNPDSTAWDATGVSTKTDSLIMSGLGVLTNTPAFQDAHHKCVCVQILWERDGVKWHPDNVKIGRAYNEVFFQPDQITMAESEEGVIISVTGMIYGAIEPIYHFAYRF